MKRIVSLFLTVILLMSMVPAPVGADAGTQTPGDFGWIANNDNFTGWTATDAANFTGDQSAMVNSGKWVRKVLATDQNNFEISMDVTVPLSADLYVKVKGVLLELDHRKGRENQVYPKYYNGSSWISNNDQWLSAAGNQVNVTVSRENGGNVIFTLTGKDNATPTVFNVPVLDEAQDYVELKVGQGAITFTDVKLVTQEPEPPVQNQMYGWEAENGNFSGWQFTDGSNMTASLVNVSNPSKRIWTNLTEDTSHFGISMDVTVPLGADAYVKVKGVLLELDHRKGREDQVYPKYYDGSNWISNNDQWLKCTDDQVHISIGRTNGGELVIVLTGKENDTPVVFQVPVIDERDEKLELRIGAETVSFANVHQGQPGQVPDIPKPAPTPGDFGWTAHNGNFTGWTATDGANVAGNQSEMVNSQKWIRKVLVTNQDNFAFSMDVNAPLGADAYITVKGVMLELDHRKGRENQVYPKYYNGTDWISDNDQWLSAAGNQVTVTFSRYNGGNLMITITGKDTGAMSVFTATIRDEDDLQVELKVGQGKIQFSNIRQVALTPDLIPGNIPQSDVWELNRGWNVNEEDTQLVLEDTTAGPARWKQCLDMTISQTMTLEWIVSSKIAASSTWAEQMAIELKDPDSKDYLYLRFWRYKSSKGEDQVYVSCQYYLNGNWSENVLDVWGTKVDGGNLHKMQIKLTWDSQAQNLRVKVLDKETDAELINKIIKASDFSDEVVQSQFTNVIMKGTSIPLQISVPNSNTHGYYILNPKLTEAEYEPLSFADYDWHNDNDDFTGWTFINTSTFQVSKNMTNIHRIWKNVFASQDNFTVNVAIKVGTQTSAYVKVKGAKVELDSRKAQDDRVLLKVNGENRVWVKSYDGVVYAKLTRKNGGDIIVALNTHDPENIVKFTVQPTEPKNINFELGIYDGTALFYMNKPAPDRAPESEDVSEIWKLTDGWSVDEEDSCLILNTLLAKEAILKQTLDFTKGGSLSMNWVTTSSFANNETWGERIGIKLRNPENSDYLYIQLRRYCNAKGEDQVYLAVQFYVDQKMTDTAVDAWGTKQGGGSLNNICICLEWSGDNALTITLTDNDNQQRLIYEKVLNASFTDINMGNKLSETILSGSAVPLQITVPYDNTAVYYLTNPKFELVSSQISEKENKPMTLAPPSRPPQKTNVDSNDRSSVLLWVAAVLTVLVVAAVGVFLVMKKRIPKSN